MAVLGDMLELGPDAERYHRETGEYAAKAGVRALWGVGRLAASTVEGFQAWWRAHAAGAEWTAGHVASAEETSSVSAALRPGDVVLLKASRSVRLETMVRQLVVEHRLANEGRPGAEAETGTKETR